MTIEINKDQATALIQLIDIAIKAGGYQNAKAGVALIEIILEAASKEEGKAQ